MPVILASVTVKFGAILDCVRPCVQRQTIQISTAGNKGGTAAPHRKVSEGWVSSAHSCADKEWWGSVVSDF